MLHQLENNKKDYMKYKQIFITKLEAILGALQVSIDVLENNKPATKKELAQVLLNAKKHTEFLLERIELEHD